MFVETGNKRAHAIAEPPSYTCQVANDELICRNASGGPLDQNYSLLGDRSKVHWKALEKVSPKSVAMAVLDRRMNGQSALGERPADEVMAQVAEEETEANTRFAIAGGIQSPNILEMLASKSLGWDSVVSSFYSGTEKQVTQEQVAQQSHLLKTVLALRYLFVELGIGREPLWIFLKRYALAESYAGGPGITGEIVDISLIEGERSVLAHNSWRTQFPRSARRETTFIAADIDLNELLSALIRSGHTTSLGVQAALARMAENNQDASVRRVAVAAVTDQALLSSLARTATDPEVRQLAYHKATGR